MGTGFRALRFGSIVCHLGPLIGALTVTTVCSTAARADDTHYNDYPIGARAVGLGGAFTALSDDPSGMFYNPAGIVDVKRTSVEVSTNLYGVELVNTDLIQSLANFDSVVAELNVIPTTAGVVKTLPERDARGRPITAYSLGSFVPSYRSINIQSLSEVAADAAIKGCVKLAYQRSLLDRTYWLGGAVAHRLTPSIRIGMGAFATYRTLLDREQSACFATGQDNQGAFATAATDLDLAAASVVATFGFKMEVRPNLLVGATLSSPSVDFLSTADLRVTRGLSAPATNNSQFALDDLKKLNAQSKTGGSLRVGIAKIVPSLATIVFDLSIHAPVRYKLVEIPRDRPDISERLTIVNDVERRFIVNAHLGAEWLVEKSWSVAAGVFTNLASSPPLPGVDGQRFSQDQLPHVNGLGGSLVLGLFGDYTLTRLGLTGSYGAGSDVVAQQDGLRALTEDTAFTKASLRQLFFFFYLSTTLRLEDTEARPEEMEDSGDILDIEPARSSSETLAPSETSSST
ncbi:MAG: hypothetical protein H6729_15890 [Deltaproteobacteria bacterium]|nr:hypothetical protein [Deltaproteobacteria bacterium]